MHELLTPAEMARADALTIEAGTPGIELMEKAGLTVADEVAVRHPLGTRVAVICGPGNNGGDGLVAARVLRQRGYPVRVALVGERKRIRGDAALALAQWPDPLEPADREIVAWGRCIIDAIFGAGLSKPVEGQAAEMIEAINRSTGEVVAVDLPSGVDGRDGAVRGAAVVADRTVTFFRKKPGHCLLPGKLHCGIVRRADIGIAASVLAEIRPKVRENTPDLWRDRWRPPEAGSHKYARGHCVAVSGPFSTTGAIRLAARAALRSGAGLVTIATPPGALAVHAAHATAVMTRAFDGAEGLAGLLGDGRIGSVVLGPGLGEAATCRELVRAALDGDRFVVLDADALTAFEAEPQALFGLLRDRPGDTTVLTPHEGEFRRIFPDLSDDAALSKIDRAAAAAARANAVMLLKGADTVIGAACGAAIVNHQSSRWLATAGSGDVLAGIVSGLGAQGIPGFEAAAMAAYMHCAAALHAGPGMIAEDLAEAIRPVIADLDADHRERTGAAPTKRTIPFTFR